MDLLLPIHHAKFVYIDHSVGLAQSTASSKLWNLRDWTNLNSHRRYEKAAPGVEEAPNRDGEDAPKKEEAEDAGWPKGLLKEELEAAALFPPKLKAELLPKRLPPPPVDEPKLKPPPDCRLWTISDILPVKGFLLCLIAV